MGTKPSGDVAQAFHPAANIFPLDDEHLQELADDIKANGLVVPIEMLDGQIIDGRRRWLACKLRGVKPSVVEVKADDPIKYVLSLNVHRRHLSPAQLSMVAGRAREVYDQQAKERKAEGGRHKDVENLPQADKGKARDQAGKAVGVSGKSVDYATTVLRGGTPALIAAVDSDKIGVSTAARMASLTPQEQDAFVNRTRGRKNARTMTAAPPEDELPEGVSRGVGVRYANEAINSLKRIPKNDRLRKRGFQIVTDWIRHNK